MLNDSGYIRTISSVLSHWLSPLISSAAFFCAYLGAAIGNIMAVVSILLFAKAKLKMKAFRSSGFNLPFLWSVLNALLLSSDFQHALGPSACLPWHSFWSPRRQGQSTNYRLPKWHTPRKTLCSTGIWRSRRRLKRSKTWKMSCRMNLYKNGICRSVCNILKTIFVPYVSINVLILFQLVYYM